MIEKRQSEALERSIEVGVHYAEAVFFAKPRLPECYNPRVEDHSAIEHSSHVASGSGELLVAT